MLRIGCGAGFAGDRLDAAVPVVRELVEAGGPACLIFEMLAERTLALAQLGRRNGGTGFDAHLLARLEPVLADCLSNDIRIVGNFGAADPAGAAAAIAALARKLGTRTPRIAVVSGDDLLEGGSRSGLRECLAAALPDGVEPMAANAYLGAAEIAAALKSGADIVVTGRVADPALALGPLVAHYDWCFDDCDRIAAGTLAGHLLECGAQVTGGYFADPGFKDVPDLSQIGFPVAEISADGSLVMTKPAGTGGAVNAQTVKEQILYEIHDPAAYLTPDVVLDLTQVEVEEVGPDRVAVRGARGRERPETLKATICYLGGHLGEAEISYAGPNALARARLALGMVVPRLPEGLTWRGDFIGATSIFGDDGNQHLATTPSGARDVRLRLALQGADEDVVEVGLHEFGALYTCGPAGGAGLRTSRRPRFHTASAFVPRDLVAPRWNWSET
ncbi:acyclic terpene utilization AtuA family protein [uncultured Jannaschia sp.]|uniref:acyclic terpene utilization AtuA family protein n=1 Tax=uncultured Jannaschia sp. TaxID=293347 RepID=UPI002611DE74|nr:acyclic terpene utilization AtuA family protein [uncultured Jannaschia sp.]